MYEPFSLKLLHCEARALLALYIRQNGSSQAEKRACGRKLREVNLFRVRPIQPPRVTRRVDRRSSIYLVDLHSQRILVNKTPACLKITSTPTQFGRVLRLAPLAQRAFPLLFVVSKRGPGIHVYALRILILSLAAKNVPKQP